MPKRPFVVANQHTLQNSTPRVPLSLAGIAIQQFLHSRLEQSWTLLKVTGANYHTRKKNEGHYTLT